MSTVLTVERISGNVFYRPSEQALANCCY